MAERALREEVGRLFLVGLEGTTLSAVERAWLRLLRPSGVILFRRNIEDPQATASLLREASTLCAAPALRAVDLEGGLVDRLRDVLAPMPAPARVAATRRAKDAREHGALIGKAARLLGFNTTLAPVLDLALPASAAVMRTRAASPDPEEVTAYGRAFLEGLRTARVLGCGKHFPGLGGGTLDSHQATPKITRNWEELWSEDLLPFRDLARQLPIVMVSHASYPHAARHPGREHKEPAAVSPFWIGTVLRRRMGYSGLVLSDDMEMGGILNYMSIEDASVRAIAVGTDLIEVCRDPALVLRAFEAVLREAEQSSSFRQKVRRAARRVDEQTAKWLDPSLPRTPSTALVEKLRAQIRDFDAKLPPLAEAAR